MKFLSCMLLLLSFTVQAFAMDLSVTIEHPAKGKRKAFKSVVTCSKMCVWESKRKSGSAHLDVFSEDLKKLNDLVEAGEIPQKKIDLPELVYVHITVKNDDKSTSFSLALAGEYDELDSEKFSKINNLVTRIEFLIQKQEAQR